MSICTRLVLGFSALLLSAPLLAATPEEVIRPIQQKWADLKYSQPEKQQPDLYRTLAEQAHQLSAANPDLAEALIWEGIVVSSEAGARGGFSALSLAEEAKRLLEKSIRLNDKALDGSAYTSLATLYAKVPGWPIGFGDRERAEQYFRKALSLNPHGIDPNFFYGEYLVGQGRAAEARVYLDAALRAAPRPGREVADRGRRQEVQALLKGIEGAK